MREKLSQDVFAVTSSTSAKPTIEVHPKNKNIAKRMEKIIFRKNDIESLKFSFKLVLNEKYCNPNHSYATKHPKNALNGVLE